MKPRRRQSQAQSRVRDGDCRSSPPLFPHSSSASRFTAHLHAAFQHLNRVGCAEVGAFSNWSTRVRSSGVRLANSDGAFGFRCLDDHGAGAVWRGFTGFGSGSLPLVNGILRPADFAALITRETSDWRTLLGLRVISSPPSHSPPPPRQAAWYDRLRPCPRAARRKCWNEREA
jgi:hypothetical protein